MPKLSISLLGAFSIEGLGPDAPPKLGQKSQALMAVLALSDGKPMQRDVLASLLWSDRDERHARDSLKHAIAQIRNGFSATTDVIEADRQTVTLRLDAIEVDVTRFEEFAANRSSDAASRALSLYRGEFLEGISVHDPAFERWLEPERRRFAKLAEDAALRVMTDAVARDQDDLASDAARRLMELDPLREDACRTLMTVLNRRGDRTAALRLFESLKSTLNAELSVAPEPETLAVYDDIRSAPLRQVDPSQAPDKPERPSIAVLAFDVAGSGAEQMYFADGIVEEIIAALSRIRWLFVISRCSSFAWRGEQTDVTEIGRRLGVRYLLTGGVRRSGERLRITGRLIETDHAELLWSETFEGTVNDVFALQDGVTERVVGSVAPRLEAAEMERARRKPTSDLDAYDYYLRGLSSLHRWNENANLEAIGWFRKATSQDSAFAAAYGLEARCYSQQKACGWVTESAAVAEAARGAAKQAVEHGQDDALALCTAGIGLAFVANEVSYGADLISRSLELNSNLASAWMFSSWVNCWLGHPEIALDHIARAVRLNPRDPETAMMYAATGYAHFLAGNYNEAARWAEKSIRSRPTYLIASCILASSKALLGAVEEAREVAARIMEIDPDMRVSTLLNEYPIQRAVDQDRWTRGLREAGIPN